MLPKQRARGLLVLAQPAHGLGDEQVALAVLLRRGDVRRRRRLGPKLLQLRLQLEHAGLERGVRRVPLGARARVADGVAEGALELGADGEERLRLLARRLLGLAEALGDLGELQPGVLEPALGGAQAGGDGVAVALEGAELLVGEALLLEGRLGELEAALGVVAGVGQPRLERPEGVLVRLLPDLLAGLEEAVQRDFDVVVEDPPQQVDGLRIIFRYLRNRIEEDSQQLSVAQSKLAM